MGETLLYGSSTLSHELIHNRPSRVLLLCAHAAWMRQSYQQQGAAAWSC